MRQPEIYVSVDIEADGPIPGPHSMLSLGAAAFDDNKNILGTFSANLLELEGANGHPDTLAWWKTQPAAWERCRKDARDPAGVMAEFHQWVRGLSNRDGGGRPVFVGYPASYDFMFVYWYLIRFVGESLFSHSALDIKTYAFAIMGKGYRDSTKKNMPRAWFDKVPHTHVAVEDAIGQGALFVNMKKHRDRLFARPS